MTLGLIAPQHAAGASYASTEPSIPTPVPDCRATFYLNLLEPVSLADHFLSHPPIGFEPYQTRDGAPAFATQFDLLTTADAAVKRFVSSLPGFSKWKKFLRPKTCFIGTTVSEYALFPRDLQPDSFAESLVRREGRRYPFVIVKDLPQRSPLLSSPQNAQANEIARALRQRGFVLMEGQALAYVPIDFPDIDAYLSRLSSARRKDIRRKLRSRAQLQIQTVETGHPLFADDVFFDRIFALYQNVYQQSEVHFDQLSRDFFSAVLQDSTNGGMMFLYWHDAELIGYNLCFVNGRSLVDKYVGFAYPQAREMNLYFISWIHNIEYALRHRLTTYIAGWTDPAVKSYLGANFTMTRHAVFVRNRFLRAILRRVAGHFECDRTALEQG